MQEILTVKEGGRHDKYHQYSWRLRFNMSKNKRRFEKVIYLRTFSVNVSHCCFRPVFMYRGDTLFKVRYGHYKAHLYTWGTPPDAQYLVSTDEPAL